MSVTRAKFRCNEVAKTENGSRVKLSPVTGGSEENENFFKWTPGGSIDLGIINPEAAAQFEPGKEYYIDFTAAN